MNNGSVLKSDYLASDSLVPAFVFYRGRQGITRLRQTSIEINWTAKVFFDNQRAAIRRPQNIFRHPYSGAIKAIGSSARARHPVRASLGKGAEHDHRKANYPYFVLGPGDAANQAQWASGIGSTLFGQSGCMVSSKRFRSTHKISVRPQASISWPRSYWSKNRFMSKASLFLSIKYMARPSLWVKMPRALPLLYFRSYLAT